MIANSTTMEFKNIPNLDILISQALAEDIGNGDHSSLSCFPKDHLGKARLVVKDTGILAGVELAELILHRVDPSIVIERKLKDGASIIPGDIAFFAHGPIVSLLTAERLLLNFMQRLSGVATRTNHFVKLVEGTPCKILDTRKTTPGLRYLEKWAVTVGGGHNHRIGLFDMIMLKDNHVDFSGGITNAVNHARSYLNKHGMHLPIEVETRNLNEVEEALRCKVDRIMLDNFDVELTHQAVKLIDGQVETESSGGITESTIRAYAETGVNYISVGALTHSVKSLDLSFKAS